MDDQEAARSDGKKPRIPFLREVEDRFQTLAQAVPALVYVADPQGQNVFTNTQFQSFVGVPAEALLGYGWLQALHPDDQARAAEIWVKAVASGGPYEAEYRFRRHDGAYRWFLVRGVAVQDSRGQVTAWYGTCTDIHETRRTAEALDEEKRTLQTLNELGRAIAAELDLERAVQRVTDAATQLTGAAFGSFFYNVHNEQGEAYTLYALSGAPREAFAKFPMPRNTEVFGPTFRGEAVVRSDDITKDPRYGHNAPRHGMPEGHLPVRSYLAVPVVSRSGEVLGGLFFGHPETGVFTERAERLVVGIAAQASIAIDNARLYQAAQREIAERTRVEAALRESERRLNAVLDNATVAIFLMDDRQRCVYMNAAAEKLTGYTLAEVQERALHDLIHHTRPDGSRYPLEECPIDQAFPRNNQEQGEEIFVHKDGRFYPVAFTASPIRDENAKVVGTIIEVRDIRAEKQAAEALREAAQRKDEFLAVLAHELRNPLAPIRNGIQIVRLRMSGDEALQRVVHMMDRQMTHVVRLVDDLLDVSRITRGRLTLRRTRVLLTDVLASAVDASRVFIETHGHELTIDVRSEGLTVDGDPERLAQVFSNLLSNSAKYTPRGGHIRLTIEREGEDAVIRVRDNGIGIPPGSLEEVFEIFSQIRSHEPHTFGGLGIGLSLARTLVEKHGGSITAHSEGPGAGSTFTVRLPLVAAQLKASTGSADVPNVPRPGAQSGSRRILVVDDNADAAASLAMLLEMEGHEVRTASGGEEGVEQAQVFRPDIILMDIGMPGVDGLEATRRIRALPSGKEIAIVALTGWGQAPDRNRTREAGMNHHLIKPVTAEALHEVFDALGRSEQNALAARRYLQEAPRT